LKCSLTEIRFLLLTALLLPVAHAATSDNQFPALIVVDHVEHYPVTGSTIRQIDRQLAEQTDRFENAGNGSTRSRFEVIKTLQPDDDGCHLSALQLQLSVTTILPEWRPQKSVSKKVRKRWNDAATMLADHEAGHRAHALAAARHLRAILDKMEPRRNCSLLDVAIALELDSSLSRLELEEARYDHRTRNGLRTDPLGGPPHPVIKSRQHSDPNLVNRNLYDPWHNR
jgi:predicted secreted Zn-dependent protease